MSELWRQCADWLRGLNVLDPKSNVFSKSARVYDLALAMQDGTVLCNLANRIIPNSVETVHENPAKQFLKMQNINAFLDVCSRGFKIKDADLFTADELYYASDFPKVLSTLSALSNSKSATTAGIKKFPSSGASNTATDESGEDMYQSLEDLVGQSISFEEAAGNSAAYDPDAEEDEEDVYGSIMKSIGAANASEDIYSEMVAAPSEESIYSTTAGDKRSNVLSEVAETEKNYVDVLNVIISKFMKPLQKDSKFNKGDVKVIFSNIETLLEVHVNFAKDVDAQMKSTTGRKLSKPFLTHVNKMKVYGQFCCDVPKAMDKLKVLEKNKSASAAIENCRQASGQRFQLKDLLNVPMQRVLKYPLLLKELIKATPDDHPDKKGLVQSKATVDQLAVYINTTKKDHDHLMDMIESLNGYPSSATPLGEFAPFIKDGDLMYKDCNAQKKDDKKLGLRYAFLLQKAVLFTKPRKTKYDYKSLLELDESMTVAEVPFWTLPKEEQNGKYSFAWSLKKGEETLHVFAAKTLPGKKKWMGLLSRCLEDLRDESAVAPDVETRTKVGESSLSPTTSKPKKSAPAAAATGRKSYEEWTPVSQKEREPSVVGDAPVSASDESSWFGGKMPRAKAEKLFNDCPDGCFLVRESETRTGEYSLSVKYNIVKHIKINRHGNKYELAPDAKAFTSIQELVEHFQTHSLNRHFPGMETTLAVPFKDAIGKSKGLFGESRPVGIGRARSRFAYTARSHDELTFERGVELIIITKKDPTLDPGWWKGSLPNGQVGIFPANYVQQL